MFNLKVFAARYGRERVNLAAVEQKTVRFKLTPRHLAILDRNLGWVAEPGKFRLMVGSSSADIRLNGEFEMK